MSIIIYHLVQFGICINKNYFYYTRARFFNMTIRENLLLIKPNATDMEIIDSCRKAGIYDYIKKLPYGLETVIGENGIRISRIPPVMLGE